MSFDVEAYLDRTYERCIRGKEDLHDEQREALRKRNLATDRLNAEAAQ